MLKVTAKYIDTLVTYVRETNRQMQGEKQIPIQSGEKSVVILGK